MTNREKLLQAAELISQVVGCLDISEGVCEHCNVKKRHFFEQYKANQELQPIVTRLKRFANSDSLKAVLDLTTSP